MFVKSKGKKSPRTSTKFKSTSLIKSIWIFLPWISSDPPAPQMCLENPKYTKFDIQNVIHTIFIGQACFTNKRMTPSKIQMAKKYWCWYAFHWNMSNIPSFSYKLSSARITQMPRTNGCVKIKQEKRETIWKVNIVEWCWLPWGQ